jgi:hypothetical protein
MGAYEKGRDNEYLARLDAPINNFIAQYAANPSLKNRRTIFLFPGGMGSQLARATNPYNSTLPSSYPDIWLNCDTVFGSAVDLQMHKDIDFKEHYIVPDGCVDFPALGLQPYDGFVRWCQDNLLDLFVFGWDWRRDAKHTADFFLNKFMPKFKRCVKNCVPNPLDDFTLLSHSFGGLVVKLILSQTSNKYVKMMKRAITVAAPFYGYGGQVHRYFTGDPDLNRDPLYGPTKVTEIVSTCPGGYELMFLDEATFDSNKNAFAQDPDGYNLTDYPSVDATTQQRADPYKPVPGEPTSGATGCVRYISNHKFGWKLLADALRVRQDVASKLDSSVASKFCNIRGVQTASGTARAATVVRQTWSLVCPTFDPDFDTDPIVDHYGPGDGVIPAWSARFAPLPDNRIKTVTGDFQHMDMMNYQPVQDHIWDLLGLPLMAMKPVHTRKMAVASRANLNKFLDGLQAAGLKKQTPKQRAEAMREYLRRFSPEQLRKFVGRIYIDALKSPSQKVRPKGRIRAQKRSSRGR